MEHGTNVDIRNYMESEQNVDENHSDFEPEVDDSDDDMPPTDKPLIKPCEDNISELEGGLYKNINNDITTSLEITDTTQPVDQDMAEPCES